MDKTPEQINAEKKQAKADQLAADEAVKKQAEADNKKLGGTFIMNVGHLSWGNRSKNHFFADDKPEISAKVMGKYASLILKWLDAGWIKKGSYKK